MESEIRVFQDLLTHLNRTRDLTGRNESTSKMSSSGRNAGDRVFIVGLLIELIWGRHGDGGGVS